MAGEEEEREGGMRARKDENGVEKRQYSSRLVKQW